MKLKKNILDLRKVLGRKTVLAGFLGAIASIALLSALAAPQVAISSPSNTIMGKADGGSSQQLFPYANCNVHDRMEVSREYLEEKHSFVNIQGIFPWPDFDGRVNINGIWINEARGTYAVLQQMEHPDAPKYGALVISFYSACNHQLLAAGSRVLQKRDWDTPSISIPLKNQLLNGKNLRTYIKVMPYPDNSGYNYLEIIVREARVGTRDHFYLDRF